MTRAGSWFRCAGVAAVLGALLGCEGGGAPDLLDSETWVGARNQESCLTVRPLAGATKLTRFREGEGRNLSDISVEAEFVSVSAFCGYGSGVSGVFSRHGGVSDFFAAAAGNTVNPSAYGIEVIITAWRGPAEQSDSVYEIPYFVAILDPNGRKVDKKVYTSEIRFPPGATRVTQAEPERIALKFGELKGVAPWQLDILVGFQLTPEELEYARTHKR